MSRVAEILALPKVTHNLVQGSDAWHCFRLEHRGASEAAAAMGLSKKVKRSELLHAKHTGLPREFSQWVQEKILDRGHEVEALARPHVERIVGDDLYPVTCSRGHVSASCDGLTMDDRTAFEHKQWNEDLAAMVAAGIVPDEHMPQCQQILLVTGAEKVIFTVSDGTPEKMVYAEVTPDPEWWERIVAAWDRFEADLAVYVPPAPSVAERIVAEPVQALPAVSVQVAGQLTVQDNFRAFEERLRDFLDNRLIRQPKTDQDFADLDVQIKAMKGAEAALDAAEAQMLAQIQTVDQAKKTKDMLAKLVRDNRLMAEKLLASEKERRRGEIVAGGISALKAYIEKLNERLGRPYMPATATAVDFGEAIKGKKALASMEDAVATKLANAKIAANEIADRIELNLRHLREHAGEFKHLFPDTATIALKAPEDLQALVTARIAEHRAAEERRAAELAERERARIRAEEQARAQREAQEAAAREQRQREEDEAERRRAEQAQITHPNGAPMFGTHVKENGDRVMLDEKGNRSVFCDVDEGDEPAAVQPTTVVPMPTRAPAPQAQPTLKLGDINRHLAPFAITAEGLRQLGFEPAGRERAAVLYHDADLPYILTAAIQHLTKAREQIAKAA